MPLFALFQGLLDEVAIALASLDHTTRRSGGFSLSFYSKQAHHCGFAFSRPRGPQEEDGSADPARRSGNATATVNVGLAAAAVERPLGNILEP